MKNGKAKKNDMDPSLLDLKIGSTLATVNFMETEENMNIDKIET